MLIPAPRYMRPAGAFNINMKDENVYAVLDAHFAIHAHLRYAYDCYQRAVKAGIVF